MKLTSNELEQAIRLWENNKPMMPVKEELGGDYYFRCGWLNCNKIIKREYNFCPNCGTMILWEESAY